MVGVGSLVKESSFISKPQLSCANGSTIYRFFHTEQDSLSNFFSARYTYFSTRQLLGTRHPYEYSLYDKSAIDFFVINTGAYIYTDTAVVYY